MTYALTRSISFRLSLVIDDPLELYKSKTTVHKISSRKGVSGVCILRSFLLMSLD